MRSALLLLLASLLVFPPLNLATAQQKPAAALCRVATLGPISEAQKKIITTRLESKLSESYNLISREQYRRAEEAAFAELDVARCTEEECIRKIQEILQVERLFILQIVREKELTQLSLNLVRLDAKRVVEKVCENCSIGELYEQIDALADQLITEDIQEGVREMIAAQPVDEAPPPAVEEEDGGFPWWGWALIVVGGLVAAVALGGGDDGGGDGGGGGGDTGSVGFGF